MARWKFSLSSLVLLTSFCSLFIFSNSAALTNIPSWTATHQLHTRSPEFNVISTDEGVPTLESGENPAKDPQLIVEGPLPIDTPDPFEGQDPTEQLEDADFIKPTPISPSQNHDDEHSIFLPHGDSDHNHDRETEPSAEDENADYGYPDEYNEGFVTQSPLPKPSKGFQSSKKSKSSETPEPLKAFQTSKKPKKVKPSAKPTSTSGHHGYNLADPSAQHPDLDEPVDPLTESSPKLEDDSGESSSFAGDQDLSGEQSQENGSALLEPSALPNYGSTSEPSNAPVSGPSNTPSSPGNSKQSASLQPSNAATVITSKPGPKTTAALSIPKPSVSIQLSTAVPNNGGVISEGGETEPEPSFLESEVPDPSLSPTKTGSVPDPSSNVAPTAVGPIPEPEVGSDLVSPSPSVQSASSGSNESKIGSKDPKQESPTASSNPTEIVIEAEATTSTDDSSAGESADGGTDSLAQPPSEELDGVAPASTSGTEPEGGAREEEDGETVQNGFVQPNGTYKCINFAAKTFADYKLFEASAFDGSYSVYKGSGVALNPSLPVPYRYHVYGEKWTYHLNVSTNSPQKVILGFAEVFPKACASGREGSFRVFTVSVGDNFQIVDVMKSSGCGVVLQSIFEDVMPTDQVIDLNFSALSGKAMVSVICYGDVSPSSAKSASTQTETPNMPEMGAEPGPYLEDSKPSYEKCFRFGAEDVKGFTSFTPSELGKDILMYTDDSASVYGTSHPEVYKSHVFGTQFALILDVGPGSSKTVNLGFAEIYQPGCKEGFRVFTVKAGSKVRTVDVFKEVGCNSLYLLQFQNITPSDHGIIAIAFNSMSNFAMISSVCVADDERVYTSTSPSLVVVSDGQNSEDDYSAQTQVDEESNGTIVPANQTQSEEDLLEQSMEPENYHDPITGPSPQGSPFPKENGLIIVESTEDDTGEQRPNGSPYPKVNGVIDASITTSPTVAQSPTAVAQPAFGSEESGNGTTDDAEDDPSSMDLEAPQPSDELLPSGFSQTTLGEDPNSPPETGLSGVSGEDTGLLTPTPSANLSSTASPTTSSVDEFPIAILPTRTPTPSLSPSPSGDMGNNSVTNKQGDDVVIEAASPSATALAVSIEAPSPSATGVTVTIEAPSPSVTEFVVTIEGPSPSASVAFVTIVGTGPAAESGVPTPTIISAAAFSPVPSAAMSSPPGENTEESSSTTPQPIVTAVVLGSASTEPSSLESASPLATPSTDAILPPVDSTSDEPVISNPSPTTTPSAILPEPSESEPDGSEVLTSVIASSGPQGTPTGFDPGESAVSSPAPATTISQNQIIVIPSASAMPVSTQAPTTGPIPPSPSSTEATEQEGSSPGIGAPEGVVFGTPSPDPTILSVSGSISVTPSPSRATSSVGSSEVIVDSPTSAPSFDPVPSISVGGPDEGPVEVSDNTTEIFEVTGDIGTGGSGEDNQPSILVGEYKEIIATTPAGSGFAIAMGLVGSLLVILLLVCLFFAIFRGGGAAYSYSSAYSSHKPTDYDPDQGRYTDDLGLGPTGYGNEPRYAQNTQDGYGTEPVTFESRPDGPSEPFGFEMPAATQPETGGDTRYRNEEPDTIAEYSSLNLHPSGYDLPRPETTESLRTRETGIEQATPGPQFLDTHSYHPDKARAGDSYETNPGEYTFTGTFSMPNKGYSQNQRDREHEAHRDSGHTAMHQELSTYQDSFNDHHSTARPTITSESSGKQGRVSKNFTVATGLEIAKTSDAILVDDVRSSLLDSEQGSTSMLSVGSNPAAVQSPYETQPNVNINESNSGNVIEQDFGLSASGALANLWQHTSRKGQHVAKQDTESPVPVFDRKRSEMIAGATNSVRTNAEYHSVLPSSASNDEPWPWWWSGENTRQHRMSAKHKKPDQMIDGKENSSISSNGITSKERYQNPGTRNYQKTGDQGGISTGVTAKGADTQTNQSFVPDSSWRRQYSSTSDEGEDETPSNPYFEDLRRRREPYVKSVANRLSVGPGSFPMSMSVDSDFEARKNQVALDHTGAYAIRSAQEVSSWITRDPVEL